MYAYKKSGMADMRNNQAIKGLIHKSNLPDDYITHFTVGQIIPVIIKAIRTEKCQIELLRRE